MAVELGLRVVGQTVLRVDGPDKATGKAVYVADLELPGMLHARAVRSPHAHALIRAIDTAEAMALPGVVAVLTATDVPGVNLVGSRAVRDQPVLVGDHVRFLGEAVALVVATTAEVAAAGASVVKVDYQPLPGVFSPEEALRPGAPRLTEKGNLCCQSRVRRGDFAAVLSQADLVVENVYQTPFVDHAFLEPHGAVAGPDGDTMNVWITTKTVHQMRDEISRVLGRPKEKVRIIAATIGGSFGGKPDIPCGCLAALAAAKVGRPVKLVYTRQETFQVSAKRHPYVVRLTHAVARDGTILGVKGEIVADAGAYTSESRAVIARAAIHCAGPYYIPNVDVEGKAVFTNQPVTGAMRGYGVPQVAFAHEVQMDIIAARLGLDPIEVRRRNVLKPGLTTVTGQVVPEGCGAEACLTGIRDLLDREEPVREGGRDAAAGTKAGSTAGSTSPGEKTGWGIALFYYGNGRTATEDVGRCRLRREADGTFTLFVGVPDVGQGSTTILAQIACEELGVPWSTVKVVPADSASSPETGPASASRTTVVVGRAVQDAARKMRQLIQTKGGDVDSQLEVDGVFGTDSTALDENGQGDPYSTYTYGVQAIKVAVDPATGKVEMRRALAAYDVGQVINPMLFSGQVEGGVANGLGYALYEVVQLAAGWVMNPNFHTYLIPTAPDTAAPVTAQAVTSSDGAGPFAAKGIGEPASIPTAPAVANAICAATGSRFLALPITMEEIYRSLCR
ncbi:MAG TPA: xanthine dehydrogenase family protein molybdopterin-binding subunit [Bacillota bacterium]